MAYRTRRSVAPVVALTPAILIVAVAYLGTMLWTVWMSFTTSRLLPANTLAGSAQYERLLADPRWLLSVQNMVLFGVLFIGICLVLGFLLAVAIDQRVRAEDGLRTIFLYPYAMSFIVTGLVWQWMMNPTLGIQETVQALGWASFRFDWVVRRDMAIYAIVIAGVWQSAGLVMALMLAGLRGIDEDLWKAARVDGIPTWRVYTSIVIPLLKPMIITAVVLLSLAVVKVYDLVVALTNGGPGTSTIVPAKYVMDYLFERQNIGLAAAGSTVLLAAVLCVLLPWLYTQYFRDGGRAGS